MKTNSILLSTLLVFLFLCSSAYAKVWTVSNDATRPAQFTTIAAAVTAASPGDTLRVAGSLTPYGVPTLYFPLVFIGEGANNPNGNKTMFGTTELSRLNSSLGSGGSKFYGIEISSVQINPSFAGSTESQRILENFTFERCNLPGGMILYINHNLGPNTIKNILIRNCLINQNVNFSGSSGTLMGMIFTNCIFDGSNVFFGGSVLNGNLIIRNSLFLNSTSARFNSMNGIIVENCIFYKAEPTGTINSVFNNNITYLCNAPTIPYGSNVGSGNLIGVNPLFINYPPLGANFAWSHNYGLQPGSPGIGTGSNGSNIGLTGGNAPINNIPGNSRIPVVTGLTLPTASVPVGGTLEVNIQAISRN